MEVKDAGGKHSLWSGVISFGLVNIPVRLYPASEEKGLAFNYLHKKDMSPIRYVKMCKAGGEEVPFKELVRGYEYKKGQYVVLEEQDFRNASPRRTQTIDILSFADESQVCSELLEKPFYLEPQKEVRKAYFLLKEALEKSKKVAIGKFVLKTREHLCMLKPEGNVIILDQLRYYSELRQPGGLDLPAREKVTAQEMDLALELIKRLSKPFEPEKLKDTYAETLKTLIAHKAKGKTFTVQEEPAAPTNVIDIMDKLKESLVPQKPHIAARPHAQA
jgi:DNA end-binding protein Ku